jgi:hypothetical protein
MYAMMMQNLLKISAAKKLAAEIKYLEWDLVTFNFYHKSYKGYISTREIYPLITGNTLLQVI